MKDILIKWVAALAVIVASVGQVQAGIIITIEGNAGSADFSIIGSGSNTMTSSVASQYSSLVRIPTGGFWQNPFLSTFGNILNGTPNYNDLIALSGAVTLSVSGSTTFSRQHNGLRLLSSFPDEFALTTAISTLPNLISGDVVALFGTANFAFTSGDTFDSVWNTGVYNVTPTPNGGSYTVVIQQSSAVPTPATLALFGLGLAGLGWSRRKKA